MEEIVFVELPLEIIVNILELLSIKDLITLCSVNRELREIIKNVRLSHVISLKGWTDEKLINIVENYNFINFDLSLSNVTDVSLEYLTNCRTVNLSFCKLITDEGIKALKNCHTVILSFCRLVTDEGIKFLGNCHTVNLIGCDQVTDEGIKALKDCHTVNLSGCKLVTN